MKQDEYDPSEHNVYVELSRLAHDAFVNRQQYEWRFCFSIWTALGLTVYFSLTEDTRIIYSSEEGYLCLLVLLVVNLTYGYLTARGHSTDKGPSKNNFAEAGRERT